MSRLPGLYLRGLVMGLADVVPGVSGGTMALITGIYEELIRSLAALHPRQLLIWRRAGFFAFWQAINGSFLCTVFAGIVSAIALFARLMGWLLGHYPVPVWAFFCGLIAASVVPVWRTLKAPAGRERLLFVAGATLAAGLAFVPGLDRLGDHPLLFFAAAMLAICAMILPGISGSFILLLLGMYVPVLDAVRGGDLLRITAFVAGAAAGLLSFVHLLRYLLERFHDPLMAVLGGFMAGSLIKLWPWRLTETGRINEHWVLPGRYAREFGDAMLLPALLAALAGILVIVLLVTLDRRLRH